MALPTLTKTWQHTVNLAPAPGATAIASFQNILLALKNALKGFGSSAWTVARCSDSTQVKTDGTDLWALGTNIIGATGAHSWMVLYQAGTGASICLDCNSANTGYMTWVVSFAAGFTGGTTTARPTATDEQVLVSSTLWFTTQASAFSSAWHVMQSTDGLITRIVGHYSNGCRMLFGIERLENTTLSTPVVVMGFFNVVVTRSYLLGSTGNKFWFRSGSTTYQGFPTEEQCGAAAVGAVVVANEISSEWPVDSMGFLNATDSGVRGRHGTFIDFWWGSSTLVEGAMYPGDGSKTFAHPAPGLVIPWNGTTMSIA